MIEFTVLKTKVLVSPLFFAVLTAFLLADKNGIAKTAVLFSVLHELGHFLALKWAKTRPKKVTLSVFGIHLMLANNLCTAKKCLVLMAGFTVNFFLAALFFALGNNLFGYINMIIGIFTFFPLASTDGGTVIKIILEEFFSKKAEKIFNIISAVFVLIFSMVLIVISILTKNYFILIAVVYMLLCVKKTAV